MLEMSDEAIAKIKGFIDKQANGACLRIFMAPGCCGPSLAMDITTKAEKEDSEMEIKNFKFFVAKDAAEQLADATIDCDKEGSIVVKGLPGHGGSCGDDCGCGHEH